jgi:hypothetical protein
MRGSAGGRSLWACTVYRSTGRPRPFLGHGEDKQAGKARRPQRRCTSGHLLAIVGLGLEPGAPVWVLGGPGGTGRVGPFFREAGWRQKARDGDGWRGDRRRRRRSRTRVIVSCGLAGARVPEAIYKCNQQFIGCAQTKSKIKSMTWRDAAGTLSQPNPAPW